jgi:hypothetical protein
VDAIFLLAEFRRCSVVRIRVCRAAIYARVSTLIGQSPEMQLAELRDYASRRGWEVYGEYVDSGISGSKESRPELNRLMSDVHLRRFDVVLCWKVDHFGARLSTSSMRSPTSILTAWRLSVSATIWTSPRRSAGSCFT